MIQPTLQQLAPYFGYLASLCLILGLLVNNDLKFRWFNSIGNVSYIIYAILLLAIPVLLTNLILLCINIFYLVKIYTKTENFDLLEFKGDEKLAQKFIQYQQKDLTNYFPHFNKALLQQNLNFVVTRDLVIANMFSASLDEAGDAYVALNYTVPKFRDFKVGRFIFEKEKSFLLSKGIKRIIYRSIDNKNHQQFLNTMGFQEELVQGKKCYVKEIS